MEAAETIAFVVMQPSTTEESQHQASTSASHSVSADVPLLVKIVKKVASDVNVNDVISGKRILKEEEINVEDCVLDQEERLTLYRNCRKFLIGMRGLQSAITQGIAAGLLETSSFPCIPKLKMKTFGYFIAIRKSFPKYLMAGIRQN